MADLTENTHPDCAIGERPGSTGTLQRSSSNLVAQPPAGSHELSAYGLFFSWCTLSPFRLFLTFEGETGRLGLSRHTNPVLPAVRTERGHQRCQETRGRNVPSQDGRDWLTVTQRRQSLSPDCHPELCYRNDSDLTQDRPGSQHTSRRKHGACPTHREGQQMFDESVSDCEIENADELIRQGV